MIGRCYMCGRDDKEVSHVALYTMGSEGTLLCNDCSILITEFIFTMQRYHTKQKVQKYRDDKLKEK